MNSVPKCHIQDSSWSSSESPFQAISDLFFSHLSWWFPSTLCRFISQTFSYSFWLEQTTFLWPTLFTWWNSLNLQTAAQMLFPLILTPLEICFVTLCNLACSSFTVSHFSPFFPVLLLTRPEFSYFVNIFQIWPVLTTSATHPSGPSTIFSHPYLERSWVALYAVFPHLPSAMTCKAASEVWIMQAVMC